MPSAGTYLRERREARGIPLEEIARATRVRQRYLEALEADDFGDLPPAVFTRGFLRAYCQALNEAPDGVLRLYAEQTGQAAPPVEQRRLHVRAERDLSGQGQEPVLVSLVLLVVLGVALFAVTFALQTRPRHNGAPAPPPITAPARSTNEGARRAGEPASLPVAASSERGSGAAAPRAPSEGPAGADLSGPMNRLVARVKEKTWMRIQAGDGKVTEELMNPGDVREWISDRRFVLTIGNAGGLILELNGQELPPLGARGQLVRQLVLPAEPP